MAHSGGGLGTGGRLDTLGLVLCVRLQLLQKARCDLPQIRSPHSIDKVDMLEADRSARYGAFPECREFGGSVVRLARSDIVGEFRADLRDRKLQPLSGYATPPSPFRLG